LKAEPAHRTARHLPTSSLQTHCDFVMNIGENPVLNTIAALAGKRDLISVKQGEIIFRKGEIGDKLYAVVSGGVQLNWGDDGVEKIGPGSSFGIGALLEPEHRRFGTAVAFCDSELLQMNREELLFAIQELPMFGLEMLFDLEQRLQRLKEHIGKQ
jgi:CRP/FNR family cyclic AMP-dependent transcriptional regulator